MRCLGLKPTALCACLHAMGAGMVLRLWMHDFIPHIKGLQSNHVLSLLLIVLLVRCRTSATKALAMARSKASLTDCVNGPTALFQQLHLLGSNGIFSWGCIVVQIAQGAHKPTSCLCKISPLERQFLIAQCTQPSEVLILQVRCNARMHALLGLDFFRQIIPSLTAAIKTPSTSNPCILTPLQLSKQGCGFSVAPLPSLLPGSQPPFKGSPYCDVELHLCTGFSRQELPTKDNT